MFENFTETFFILNPFDFPVLWLFTFRGKSETLQTGQLRSSLTMHCVQRPVAPSCQCSSNTCSSTAFQSRREERESCFFPATKRARQLKTFVLSFLTFPNSDSFHYLNTRIVPLLFIKPPCLYVKLTFCYWAGLSLSDTLMTQTGLQMPWRGVRASRVVWLAVRKLNHLKLLPETW